MHIRCLRVVALTGAALLFACGDKTGAESEATTSAEASTSTTSSGTESTGTESETTSTDTTDTSSTTDASTTGFVNVDMVSEAMCDIWNFDDCGDGEKCIPYAMGGSSWDALKCIPVDENAKTLGDECNAPLGGAGGQDDCENGLFCYYVDGETNTGTCIAHCMGSPSAPTCGPDTVCTIVNDGVLTLCRPTCDPVLQDCDPTGSACWQATGTNGFTCIIDSSGDAGAYGDPCEFINSCDPGLACADANGVPGCTGSGCCTPFCDVNEPNNCPDAAMGQTCEPYYDMPDPGYEHVGICVIPAPDKQGPNQRSKSRRPETLDTPPTL